MYSVLIFVAPLEFFTGRDNKYFLLRLPEAWRNLPVASNDNKYIYCVCQRRVKLATLPSTNPPYKRQLLAHGTSDDAKHQNDAHRTLLDCLSTWKFTKRLPRNLHMEVHKALCLPRNLHFKKQVKTLITMEGRFRP